MDPNLDWLCIPCDARWNQHGRKSTGRIFGWCSEREKSTRVQIWTLVQNRTLRDSIDQNAIRNMEPAWEKISKGKFSQSSRMVVQPIGRSCCCNTKGSFCVLSTPQNLQKTYRGAWSCFMRLFFNGSKFGLIVYSLCTQDGTSMGESYRAEISALYLQKKQQGQLRTTWLRQIELTITDSCFWREEILFKQKLAKIAQKLFINLVIFWKKKCIFAAWNSNDVNYGSKIRRKSYPPRHPLRCFGELFISGRADRTIRSVRTNDASIYSGFRLGW